MPADAQAAPAGRAGFGPAALMLLGGVLAMSWGSILVRWAAPAPPLVVGAGRLTLATLFLAPLAWARALPEWRALTRDQWLRILVSGVALSLHFATWISSLSLTSVASSVVLVSMTPLFVALAAPLLLGEQVRRVMALSVALAILGSIVIGISDARHTGGALSGDLLALTGALMAAVYMLAGRVLRRDLSLLAYIWPTYGVAALLLLAGCALAGQRLVGLEWRPVGVMASPWASLALRLPVPVAAYELRVYGFLVLLALVPQILGHSTANWALRYLSPTFVTVAILGEPLGATALAFLLLGERPPWALLVGGIVVLVGIGLAIVAEKQGAGR